MLVIDIGNSTINMALLRGQCIFRRFSIAKRKDRQLYLHDFRNEVATINKKEAPLEKVIVCSVVPELTRDICTLVEKHLCVSAQVVGHDLQVPIKNNYGIPETVGQDRLVCANAAWQFFQSACIVIDFGTAITFDYVSQKGAYEGGMILPGIRLSAKSLFEQTALLPELKEFKAPKQPIGKTTEESILNGLFYGYGQMCSGLIRLLQKQPHGQAKVILTGGYTHLIKDFIDEKIDKIDTDLMFKGLALLVNKEAVS